MKIHYLKGVLFLMLVMAATAGCASAVTDTVVVPEGGLIEIDNGVPEMRSAGVMAFAEDNALLVADYETGTIFAFEVDHGSAPISMMPYNITDIDLQIATLLGTTVDQIVVNDMIAHPVNFTAYLSVMVGEGGTAQPALFNVDNDGFIEWVDLSSIPYTLVTLEGLPDEGAVFGNNIPLRRLSITDIDYHDGALFVSGLSNAERSSEIRRIPYPFDGTVSVASTEIYHTSNDQIETRSPIRSQTIIESEDGAVLLAAYAGTPLVTFPLSDIQDGAHVRGKTIAELGYGSTPIDVLVYSEFGTDKVLVTHSGYNVMTFEVEQVLTADAGDGLTESVDFGSVVGVNPSNTALSAVSQMTELGTVNMLMLRTNRETGNLDLVSTIKSVFFRLSDFQSEYDSAGYNYPDDGSQRSTKFFHNFIRIKEGHPEEVVVP
ncbi:MAG: hypothetical protein AAF653_15445 [Chloroflexota bacterium]